MSSCVVLSHSRYERSVANRRLHEAILDLPDVEVRMLEALYPDDRIDVPAEQAAAERARRIVLQFPLSWYATPPLLKRWQDEVLAFGWSYGPGGTRLHGKTMQVVVTVGGEEASYSADGYNLYPLQDLLRPLEVTARFMGMRFAEPLALYGVPNIPGLDVPLDDARVAAFARRYREILSAPVE